MPSITDNERKFIRHALGLTAKKEGYRNRYCAGGDDLSIGKSLTQKGLAVHYPDKQSNDLFVITTAGFNAVKKAGETMDREEIEAMKIYDHRARQSA